MSPARPQPPDITSGSARKIAISLTKMASAAYLHPHFDSCVKPERSGFNIIKIESEPNSRA